MTWTTTEAERVRTIEVEQAQIQKQLKDIDSKLDELLSLKNKGMGAFWVLSIVMGGLWALLSGFIGDFFK